MRCVHRGRGQPRDSAQPGLQRRDAGRRLLRTAHHQQWPPCQFGNGVPASGDEARQRARSHPCARDQHRVRRQARGRRALCQGREGWRGTGSARTQGSDPVRWRIQFAAAPATVRRRFAGTAAIAWHPRAPCVARCRRRPAGSLRAAFGGASEEHQDHQRTCARHQSGAGGDEVGGDAARNSLAVADHGLLLLAFRRNHGKLRSATDVHARELQGRRAGATGRRARHDGGVMAAAAGKPGLCALPLQRSVRAADHPDQLSRRST